MASEEQKVENLVRALPGAGHISIAILYMTMGLLAGLVALGLRGETPDVRASVRALLAEPFGPILLVIVAAGSICLVIWRLMQAVADLEGKGRSLTGLVQRARYLFGAVAYLGLPVLIFRTFLGTPGRSGEHVAREVVSRVIHVPFGWSIVVAVGISLFCTGFYCFYRMIRGNFEGWFHCEEMTEFQRALCFALGRLGYAARGSILLVIGFFVIRAGWNLNPHEVEGQAGALRTILMQPFGPLLLGMVAVGLISFGGFSLLSLRYGKVPVRRAREVLGALREQTV